MNSPIPCDSFSLNLSGSHWHIRAGDAEASPIVEALGKAMSLSPKTSPSQNYKSQSYQELRIVTRSTQNKVSKKCNGSTPIECILPPPRNNNDRLFFCISLAALEIARAELSRGGLLIHGALAVAPDNIGGGIIFAGPADAGKTTASNRLPLPWRSLSDDTSLVVRDDNGQYWAHPWPTWSRFFRSEDGSPGLGGSWDVQKGVPLRAIYFLKQAEKDEVSILPTTSALTYTMDVTQLVSSLMTRNMPLGQKQEHHKNQLNTIEELIKIIPTYSLHLSLNGSFWKNIEENLSQVPKVSSLQVLHSPAKDTHSRPEKTPAQTFDDDNTITVCYSGSSMNPTLRSPDILEVIPYSEEQIREGDIVYYTSPINSQKVIHRVVRVTTDGIITRGDNNSEDDLYILQQNDIIGRVSAARRYGKHRKIAGGTRGKWFGHWAVSCNRTSRFFTPILHWMYYTLAKGSRCLLRFVLPFSTQPCVVEFKQRYQQPSIFKLMFNRRVIGYYDAWDKIWVINRPWRLLVDESKLPINAGPPSTKTVPLDNSLTNNEVHIRQTE